MANTSPLEQSNGVAEGPRPELEEDLASRVREMEDDRLLVFLMDLAMN